MSINGGNSLSNVLLGKELTIQSNYILVFITNSYFKFVIFKVFPKRFNCFYLHSFDETMNFEYDLPHLVSDTNILHLLFKNKCNLSFLSDEIF